MTATGHALIGTVIAAKIGDPYLAIPIAFFSHLILDLIPHWDAGTHGEKKTSSQLFFEAGLDVIIGFGLSYLLITYLFPATDLSYAFIIIIVAQLLDWLTAPYYIFKFHKQPFKFFYQLSSDTNSKLDKPWGIVTQVVVVALAILLGKLI